MESGSEQYKKSIKDFQDNIKIELRKLFNKTGIKMVSKTRKLQDQNNNYATRSLSNKTNYRIKENKNSTILSFGSNAKNKGFEYGLVQEFGRKKGKFPNIKSIAKWVRKKVSLGHIKLDKELGRNQGKRIDTLTFLIARAIKEKGIKGKFYYFKGFENGSKYFNENIDKIILKAFNE